MTVQCLYLLYMAQIGSLPNEFSRLLCRHTWMDSTESSSRVGFEAQTTSSPPCTKYGLAGT